MTGLQIGPYLVRATLGRGGMGAVYRAQDPRTGQDVALKLLLQLDPGRLKRFAREVDALRRLRHPAIVPLRDAGEHDGAPYLVMDLYPDPTLAERIHAEGPLPPQEAAEHARELAEALA